MPSPIQPQTTNAHAARNFIAAATAAIPIPLTILYAAGVIVSDRYAATQWLAWLPAWMLLTAASASFLPAAILSTNSTTNRCNPTTRRIIVTSTSLTLAAILHAGLIHKTFANPRQRTPQSTPLRVVVWNATGAPHEQALNALSDISADVYIITHRGRTRWTDQLADNHNTKNSKTPITYKATEAWPATIVTHIDITRIQTRTLGLNELLPPIQNKQSPTRQQPGFIVAFELDTSDALSEPITVWLLDLPSNPSLPRMQAALQTVNKLGGPAQPTHNPDRPYNESDKTLDSWSKAPAGLARPHLLVGDLNLNLNAASIRTITGNMRHAHHTAGTSLPGTWPRRLPLLHIDHAFLSNQLRAHNYSTPDPGAGTHRLQIFEITHHHPRPAPKASPHQQEHQTQQPRPE